VSSGTETYGFEETTALAVVGFGGDSSAGQILSIGQGKHSLATLLDELRRVDASYLIDVRSTPYSRHQPEFAREHLELSLRGGPIKYVYMGDLLGGRPTDPECYTAGRVDYAKTSAKEFFKRGIARLRKAYEQGHTVCLFCSEGQPTQCHRSKLIGEALAAQGIEVVHLLPDGADMTQSEVIADLVQGQAELFPLNFLSRKQYRPVRGM